MNGTHNGIEEPKRPARIDDRARAAAAVRPVSGGDDGPDATEGSGSEVIGGMTGPDGPLLQLIKDRRVAFLIVGVVNTVVGFAWFVLFELTIGRVWGYMATLLFAHVFSVLCAFVLYRRFVFRVRGHVWIDLARFETVYLTSLGINAVLLPLLVELCNLEPIVAQALIVIVTTLVSYFGHSRFSFRRKGSP